MVILTSDTSSTFKAQIRSTLENGFKQLYTGSCTSSAKQAARNLVRKWFGDAAAETVRQVKTRSEIDALVGDFFADPSRKQVFDVWTFDHVAKPASPADIRPLLPTEIVDRKRNAAPSLIEAQVAEYDRAGEKAYLTDAAPVEVLAPSSLLDGAPNTSLSPIEAAALSAVDTAWADASRLAGMVKTYARAGTAAKSLCGLRLRALREHYFGPRNPNGGRPKKGESSTTWDSMLADRLGITSQTGANWMKMADAIEQLAEHQGLDLRTTCEKLPWDWTPEESALIDATVHKLCEDKSQRDLLQADFLSDLGYEAPEKPNSSNNPLGKNGGKKKPASTPAALLKERQEAARLIFLGTDKAGRAEKGSVALFMETFIGNKGADLEALPQGELRDLYEHTVKPFAAAFRKLAGL